MAFRTLLRADAISTLTRLYHSFNPHSSYRSHNLALCTVQILNAASQPYEGQFWEVVDPMRLQFAYSFLSRLALLSWNKRKGGDHTRVRFDMLIGIWDGQPKWGIIIQTMENSIRLRLRLKMLSTDEAHRWRGYIVFSTLCLLRGEGAAMRQKYESSYSSWTYIFLTLYGDPVQRLGRKH